MARDILDLLPSIDYWLGQYKQMALYMDADLTNDKALLTDNGNFSLSLKIVSYDRRQALRRHVVGFNQQGAWVWSIETYVYPFRAFIQLPAVERLLKEAAYRSKHVLLSSSIVFKRQEKPNDDSRWWAEPPTAYQVFTPIW